MTDPTPSHPKTPGADDAAAARLARIEELQRRRAAAGSTPARAHPGTSPVGSPTGRPAARRRRPHPAKGARVAATGLSLTAMFGLVTAMGLHDASTAATAPTTPAAPAGPAAVATAAPGGYGAQTDVQVGAAPTAPAPLTSRPQVTVTVPATPAPTASTHGSR